MPKFKDGNGNEWTVDLNYGILEQIKADLDVDLFNLLDESGKEKLEKQLNDNRTTFHIIYYCIQDQLKEQGVSDVDFGRSMKLKESREAWKAVRGGLLDFFQGEPEGEVLTVIFNLEDEVQETMRQKLEEVLPEAVKEAEKVKQRVEAKLTQAIQEEMDKMESISGISDGNSEDSATATTESTA